MWFGYYVNRFDMLFNPYMLVITLQILLNKIKFNIVCSSTIFYWISWGSQTWLVTSLGLLGWKVLKCNNNNNNAEFIWPEPWFISIPLKTSTLQWLHLHWLVGMHFMWLEWNGFHHSHVVKIHSVLNLILLKNI